MKEYKSHKAVIAAKILAMDEDLPNGGYSLRLEGGGFGAASTDWVAKHSNNGAIDLRGGYFVKYADGYTSWSPAAAFEEGYTAVVHDPKDGALPVAGYKAQTPETVHTVNLNKQAEEATLQILDALESYPGIDRRWLSIGRTHIEQGWMAVNRAVFKPGRVKLPGGDPSGPHPTANPPGSPDAWRG